MPTSNFRKSAFALVVVALLAAPSVASAAPRAGGFRLQDSYSDVVAWLWNILASRSAKNGCSIDPNGRCVSSSKEGCRIDPSGRCVTDTLQSSDNGCLIDPSGHCVDPTQANKEGCSIDPFGRCIAPEENPKNGCRIDPNGGCY